MPEEKSSRGERAAKDDGTNDKSKRGKKDGKLNKIIIRRLPPTMSEENFIKQIEPIPDHEYMYFVPADYSGINCFSRAYIIFSKTSDIFIFKDKFDGYVFVDTKGNEYPAVVEFAPFQGLPKNRSRKKDPKVNTIEQEQHYLNFLDSLQNEQTETSKAENTFDFNWNKEEKKVTSTPLLEFIANKNQEKRDARKKKNEDRKKARDEERQKRKNQTSKSIPEPIKEEIHVSTEPKKTAESQTKDEVVYDDGVIIRTVPSRLSERERRRNEKLQKDKEREKAREREKDRKRDSERERDKKNQREFKTKEKHEKEEPKKFEKHTKIESVPPKVPPQTQEKPQSSQSTAAKKDDSPPKKEIKKYSERRKEIRARIEKEKEVKSSDNSEASQVSEYKEKEKSSDWTDMMEQERIEAEALKKIVPEVKEKISKPETKSAEKRQRNEDERKQRAEERRLRDEERAARRIKNKDRPAMEIYQPKRRLTSQTSSSNKPENSKSSDDNSATSQRKSDEKSEKREKKSSKNGEKVRKTSREEKDGKKRKSSEKSDRSRKGSMEKQKSIETSPDIDDGSMQKEEQDSMIKIESEERIPIPETLNCTEENFGDVSSFADNSSATETAKNIESIGIEKEIEESKNDDTDLSLKNVQKMLETLALSQQCEEKSNLEDSGDVSQKHEIQENFAMNVDVKDTHEIEVKQETEESVPANQKTSEIAPENLNDVSKQNQESANLENMAEESKVQEPQVQSENVVKKEIQNLEDSSKTVEKVQIEESTEQPVVESSKDSQESSSKTDSVEMKVENSQSSKILDENRETVLQDPSKMPKDKETDKTEEDKVIVIETEIETVADKRDDDAKPGELSESTPEVLEEITNDTVIEEIPSLENAAKSSECISSDSIAPNETSSSEVPQKVIEESKEEIQDVTESTAAEVVLSSSKQPTENIEEKLEVQEAQETVQLDSNKSPSK